MSTDRHQPRSTPFRLPAGFRWAVLAWLGGEFVAFLLLVRTIGLGGTLLLGLATTVLGVVLIRRVGLDTVRGLRRAAQSGGRLPGDALPDGLLAGFGALLLIVPGFLANAAGLALSAPSVRGHLLRRFGDPRASVPRRPGRVDVIDLAPSDWTPLDHV